MRASEAAIMIVEDEHGDRDVLAKRLCQERMAHLRKTLTLHQYNQYLEDLVRETTGELEKVQRRLQVEETAKSKWINMLAHELRSPLTSIFCITSTLFREIPPERVEGVLLDDYRNACIRIRKLIGDAVTLATLDTAADTFEIESVRIDYSMTTALTMVQREIKDVRFVFSRDGAPKVSVSASFGLLNRAFSDLLSTAACCTCSGGHVEVSMRQESSQVTVTIATQGAMLPADDLDTFFAIGGQRTLFKSGADFGLGPALANRILQLFHGTADVHNVPDKGIVIAVRLPLL